MHKTPFLFLTSALALLGGSLGLFLVWLSQFDTETDPTGYWAVGFALLSLICSVTGKLKWALIFLVPIIGVIIYLGFTGAVFGFQFVR